MSRFGRRFLFVGTALLLLGGLAAVGGWGWHRTSQPEYRARLARQAIEAEDWDRAERFADLIESRDADLANLLRGEALVRQGEYRSALTTLNRVRGEGELRVRAASLTGQCLLRLGALREARRVFLFVEEENPDDVDAQRGLAAIAYDMGHMGAALTHLGRVAELDPNDGRPNRLIGLIHTFTDHYELAEPAFREALKRTLPAELRAPVRQELAHALTQHRRYEDALKELNQIEDSADAQGLALRAECLHALNQSADLKALLERAIRAHPDSWQLLAMQGQVLLDAKQPAIEPLEKAAKLAPSEFRVRRLLGQAYRAAGRTKEAAEQDELARKASDDRKLLNELSKKAMQHPWDADVRFELARVCTQMRKHELAEMWDKAARACQKE